MTDIPSLIAAPVIEHICQVLRDYGIAEDAIRADPEIADTTRVVVAEAHARGQAEMREAAEPTTEAEK